MRIFQNVKNWLIEHLPVEEDIALHENSSFHKWVGYPLLLIFIFAIFITYNLFQEDIYSFNKELLITTETLSDFVKFYAFPITALTIPLTLGVMFNRFHSSKQKAKSNRLIEQNNLVNNYFSHFSNFSNYTDSLEVKFKHIGLKLSAQSLHRIIFQDCSLLNFEASIQKESIDTIIASIFDEVDKYIVRISENGYYTINSELINGIELPYSVRNDSQVHSYLHEMRSIIISIINYQGAINSIEIGKYFIKKYQKNIKKYFTNEKSLNEIYKN